MPPSAPLLETRDFDGLVQAALARIPVHTPEWTNFNASDPGVTLLHLFAFLAESIGYVANQVPERNRQAFLRLLGVARRPAAPARGMVAIANEKGPAEALTLGGGLEVLAGAVAFRTELGLDVLPVDARPFVKRPLPEPLPDRLVAHYAQLYAADAGGTALDASGLRLYETVPVDGPVRLQDTVDGAVWLAVLRRPDDTRAEAAAALAGRTLSLGVVPAVADPRARLAPGGGEDRAPRLTVQAPRVPPGGVPAGGAAPVAAWRTLEAAAEGDPLTEAAVVQVSLPASPDDLAVWAGLDPLEAGTGDFPPPLHDPALEDRLVTWLRVVAPPGADAVLGWVGINAATVVQLGRVAGEALPDGTGEPDQAGTLTRTPVVPASVSVTVDGEPWRPVDDLLHAGPEVPSPDAAVPPGTAAPPPLPSRVFTVDAATGAVRFGDGARGCRPPAGAAIRASYDHGGGAAGNVGPAQITVAPALPAGLRVANPVRTWGGAEAESVREAEQQAARMLQHRDRLVSAEDFATITWRTPGVDIGRVEVLPAFSPDLGPGSAGDAAGAVTLLVIPRTDPRQPDAPEPDRLFLDAVCRHLDPRRLVTTEVFLRGPAYRDVWVSVGVDVEGGRSIAEVTRGVREALRRFLAPVDPQAPPWWDEPPHLLDEPYVHLRRGWPLGKAVARLELAAVAGRVGGVRLVGGLLLAQGTSGASETVPMQGLELPRVRGISVVAGDPLDLAALRGAAADAPPAARPVPVIPGTC